MPNITLDYGNLGSFFVANRLPGIQDVKFKAEKVAKMFYDVALNGSLSGAKEAKSLADAIKSPTQEFRDRFLNGTLFFEQVIEYLTVGGSVNGHGSQAISNIPQDRHQTARWRFSPKYQPLAIDAEKWRASQNRGTPEERTSAALSLMGAEASGGLKSQLEEISTDLWGSNTDDGSGLLSLEAGIGASASDDTTYAGISRSTINAWRGNYTTASLDLMTDPLNSNYIITKWGDMVDVVTDNGAMEEDLAFLCATDIHKAYRKVVTGIPGTAVGNPPHAGQFNIDNGRGLPYSSLHFNGIPVIRDQRATSGHCRLVDTKTTFMVGLGNSMFDLDQWALSEEATQYFARLTTISQLPVTNPRRNYNLVAS